MTSPSPNNKVKRRHRVVNLVVTVSLGIFALFSMYQVLVTYDSVSATELQRFDMFPAVRDQCLSDLEKFCGAAATKPDEIGDGDSPAFVEDGDLFLADTTLSDKHADDEQLDAVSKVPQNRQLDTVPSPYHWVTIRSSIYNPLLGLKLKLLS